MECLKWSKDEGEYVFKQSMEKDLEVTAEDLVRQIKGKKWTQVGSIIEELYEMSESDDFPSGL